MALINRVSRLFRADMHAVLDQLEEPEVLLRQAVREMAEEVGRETQQLKLMAHEKKQTRKRLTELHEEQQEFSARYDKELDTCFTAGKESLARTLIRRRLEMENRSRLLQSRLDVLGDQMENQQVQLEQHQQQLAAMQQKLEMIADQENAASDVPGPQSGTSVRDEDVELAFLQEMQKRHQS